MKTNRKSIKKIILLVLEGDNKTESTFFQNFNKHNNDFYIRTHSAQKTDITGMTHEAKKKIKDMNLNFKKGDEVYIVFDLDNNIVKYNLFRQLEKQNPNIKYIYTNPCFELLFTFCYQYSTASYTSAQLINNLNTLLKNKEQITYQKNIDIFNKVQSISSNIDVAIKNLIILEKYNNSNFAAGVLKNPLSNLHLLLQRIS